MQFKNQYQVKFKMSKENQKLANLFLNLKGSKKKRDDWIKIAKICRDVLNKSKDRKEAASKLGVSTELIRSIVSLLDLPTEIQQMIKNNEILFDAAQRINTIKNDDKNKERKRRIDVAKAISGLTSHDQREIIRYAKKFPNSSLKNYKKRVTAKQEIKEIHIAVIALEKEQHSKLNIITKKKKISLEKLLLEIIEHWLEENER